MSFAAGAESAYIQQATGGSGTLTTYETALTGEQGFTGGRSYGSGSLVATPELVAPRANGSNIAASLTVGSYNSVAQIQTGRSDTSDVSVIGGKSDNVGVLQAGNNLKSNIALLGMQGMNVAVVQGANSAPVNMLIAKLPNGAILIRR